MAEAHKLSSAMSQLPLPLAQTLRRAINAKSPHEQHNGAYYFFESTLKLAAAAQIGVYLSADHTNARINDMIEALTRPSTGHWLGLLREVAKVLAERKDASLLPLAGLHERLGAKLDLPAASAFLKFAAESSGGSEARQKLRPLDLLDGIVAYRNAELGHGAQRERAFYAEAAPLLVDAVLELIESAKPFGNLQLAVARDVLDTSSQRAERKYEVLRGDGLHLPLDGKHDDDALIPAGRVVLAAGKVRVQLHPLLVYEVDRMDRDRVGFLNKVGTRGRGDTALVKRVEYLDYDSGERLEALDAVEELAGLLTKVRGTKVSIDSVESMTRAEARVETEAAAPESGQWIGDFELISELGRGGMGIVYEALQGSLKRHVALKVLPPSIAGDPIAVARFKREIAALGRCDHPNVVKVLTAGKEGDRHYYAMEYVEGSDLGQVFGVLSNWRMQTEGDLLEGHLREAISNVVSSRGGSKENVDDQQIDVPRKQADAPALSAGRDYYTRIAEVLADAARGVDHLHSHGIIHRDLKPGNIMLTSDSRRAVIMDLGLAQMQDRSLSLTASSVKILGTLRYMPPEQLQHNLLEVTPKADIYSLGATLYELAVLSPIFDGDSEAKLISQVLQQEPRPPRSVNGRVPKDLETIITVATAKNPAERYATAAHLADDLERFAKGEPIAAKPPSTFHYLKLFYRKKKALVLTVAAALVIMLATVTVFMQQLASALSRTEEQRERAVDAETEARNLLAQSQEERRKAEDAARAEADARKAADDQRELANARQQEAEAALAEANRNLILVHEEKALRAEEGGRMPDALAHRLEAARLATAAGSRELTEALVKRADATDELTPLRLWGTQPEPFDGIAWDLELDASCVAGVRVDAFPSGAAEVWLYDVRTGAAIRVIPFDVTPMKVELSPGAEFMVSVFPTPSVEVLDLRKGESATPVQLDLGGGNDSISGLGFSSDGQWLVLAGRNGELRYFEPATGRLDHSVKIPSGWDISGLDTRAGVVTASSASEEDDAVFDAETGAEIARLPAIGWGSPVSPDRRYLLDRNSSLLWDLSQKPAVSREVGPSLDRPAFSPDSKMIVGWVEGSVHLQDAATGAKLWESAEKWFGWSAPRFHPNGKHLLVGSVRFGVGVLDVATGTVLSRPQNHVSALQGGSLSPDGRFLVTLGFDARVLMWDAWTGELLRELDRAYGSTAPVWTPDGQFLFVAAQAGITTYDVGNDFAPGQLVPEGIPNAQCRSILASADGRYVFGMFGFKRAGPWRDVTLIDCWECATGRLVKQAEFEYASVGMGLRVTNPEFGPPHLLLTVLDRQRGVHLVDGLSLHELETFTIDAEADVSFLSPDGLHVATYQRERGLWLVSIEPHTWLAGEGENYKSQRILPPVSAFEEEFAQAYFAPDGYTMYVSDSRGQITTCNLYQREPEPLMQFARPTMVICTSAECRFVYTTGTRGELECWMLPQQQASTKMAEVQQAPVDVVAAGRGAVYFSSDRYWGVTHADTRTGEVIRELKLAEEWNAKGVVGLAISPDGAWLAGGGGGEGENDACRLRVWDLRTGELHKQFELEPKTFCLSTKFSADGDLLYASTTSEASNATAGSLHVFRTSDWSELDGFPMTDAGVVSFDLSPDGNKLVTLDSKKRLIAWDAKSRAKLGEVSVKYGADVAFPMWNALDGLVYLPNGSKGISAWDPIAGKLVAELAPASGDFLRIRPLRGGRHVVSSGMSSEIVVWDCETRQIVRRIELPEGERRAIALETTPDDVLYAGVSRQILRVDLGSRKSASSLVGLTSGQFTAWSRVRTVRDLNGLELKSIRAPNRPINWVGPRNGWPQQSPAWLEPPLTEEGPDHVWARDKLRRECDGVAKTIRAQTAESWLRKFEGYRFRLETQPDGQTVRVPVPRRTMDSAGRYVGEPEGHIDYAAWYRDHVGELPTVHARKPSNGGVID